MILQSTVCLYDFITVCFILQSIIYLFVCLFDYPSNRMAVSSNPVQKNIEKRKDFSPSCKVAGVGIHLAGVGAVTCADLSDNPL
jgi:hypothetical protein